MARSFFAPSSSGLHTRRCKFLSESVGEMSDGEVSAPPPAMIVVHVRKVSGESYDVALPGEGVLGDLYEAVGAKEGVAHDRLRLITRGTTLPAAHGASTASLSGLHIGDGSSVHVVIRDAGIPPSPLVSGGGARCGQCSWLQHPAAVATVCQCCWGCGAVHGSACLLHPIAPPCIPCPC
jgi:hypothetical protein